VASIISGDRKEFAKLEYKAGTEDPEADEQSGLIDETDPEDQIIDVQLNGRAKPEPEPEKPGEKKTEKGPGLSADDQKAFDQLAVTAREFPKEYQAAVKEMKVTTKQLTLSPANAEIARQLMAKISEIVDKAN
jgi:hypothetical protein